MCKLNVKRNPVRKIRLALTENEARAAVEAMEQVAKEQAAKADAPGEFIADLNRASTYIKAKLVIQARERFGDDEDLDS
jgi:hypothetical protein